MTFWTLVGAVVTAHLIVTSVYVGIALAVGITKAVLGIE